MSYVLEISLKFMAKLLKKQSLRLNPESLTLLKLILLLVFGVSGSKCIFLLLLSRGILTFVKIDTPYSAAINCANPGESELRILSPS